MTLILLYPRSNARSILVLELALPPEPEGDSGGGPPPGLSQFGIKWPVVALRLVVPEEHFVDAFAIACPLTRFTASMKPAGVGGSGSSLSAKVSLIALIAVSLSSPVNEGDSSVTHSENASTPP